MKKFICILCNMLVLSLVSVWGQAINPQTGLPTDKTPIQYNIDFPGGTPADLVKTIENATGKPLNVIIPTDDADTQLPPLKMNDVDIPQLFNALGFASRRYVAVTTGAFGGSYSQTQTSYGFETQDNPATDNSIWYFHVEKPILPPVVSTAEVCKFYQLQPYLNHGFTVDDITTAIQTGWKMAGVTSPPELNYHKETNLLIACGKPDDLATIQNVLQTLPENYLFGGELDRLRKEVNKVKDLESQIDQLTKKVDALSANSTEKNSGK